jgi:ABC-type nitrate/sulfonate/bicarbonate transport system substrate-binding protein
MKLRSSLVLVLLVLFVLCAIFRASPTHAQPTKLNVAYASTTTNFSIAWLAKLEGIFRKYNLEVELILMQGPSTDLPALLRNNIQILYGGGTAVSRTIAAADAPIVVIGTETRYVPQRLMVASSIKTLEDLRGKKIGVSRAGLDEYVTLYLLEKQKLVPGKDVALIYTTGGTRARAAQMKQGFSMR